MDSQSPRAVSPFLAKEAADVSKLKIWRGGDDSGLPVWAQCAHRALIISALCS